MTESDKAEFSRARIFAMGEERDTRSVGSLGEKPVHRTLKYFIDSDKSHHEVKCLGSVCDIVNGQGIFEIQTRSFDRLVLKLSKFLPEHHVTVVYPLIREKTLNWMSCDGGDVVSSRKVSKKGQLSDAFPELSKIKEFIGNENLAFRIYLLAADEYRFLDGYGEDKKKRATKYTMIPTDILDVFEFRTREDLYALLPEKLPETFSAKEFYSAIRMRGRRAYFSLSFCMEIGLIKKVGKLGRAYVYEKAVPKKES